MSSDRVTGDRAICVAGPLRQKKRPSWQMASNDADLAPPCAPLFFRCGTGTVQRIANKMRD